jgi:DNA-binding CsgD family transcriptional regulator
MDRRLSFVPSAVEGHTGPARRLLMAWFMASPLFGTNDEFALAELWSLLVNGRLTISALDCQAGRCFVTLSSAFYAPNRLRRADVQVLELVLHGQAQKVVAGDSKLPASSVSSRCSRALRAIATPTSVSRSSVLFVMAALSASGLPLPSARVERHAEDGVVLSVELPDPRQIWSVSACEAEVVRMTLEGCSNRQIASARGTSPRTVANQLATIFRKVGVSGRSALKARAVEDHSRKWTSFSARFAQPARTGGPVQCAFT